MTSNFQNVLSYKLLVWFTSLWTCIMLFTCSKEDTHMEMKTASLSFKIFSSEKTDGNRLPECSENAPSYAMIVLTGPENIGSIASPERIDFDAGLNETAPIELMPGNYQLQHFAVYDADDTMIWFSPTQNEYSEYVANPLPLDISIAAYSTQSTNVNVVCYNRRQIIDQNAISAQDYVANLGAGFDVTWSEFNRYMELYEEKVASDFGSAGFTNVRIRINEEAPDATFIANLRQQIMDAINHNLNPIIAYQGHYLEEVATSDEEARQHLVDWWSNMALELQDLPSELAFNIMVEISGTYKNDYTAMNSFYTDVYHAIRESNPSRIIIFPPVNISNPDYLQYLEIPGGNDPYVMAEWHFYAAGPNPTPGHRKYWNDGSSIEERENLTGPIETAVNWMQQTGHVSWVGAWMAGNYNQGNDFSVEQQVGIASFITRTLNSYDIPFSVNAGNKYYDYENLSWFTRTGDAAGKAVRDAILDSETAAVYSGLNYGGEVSRLAEGDYNTDELLALNIFENISSIMVPFDYEVIIYDNDNFSGNSAIIDQTIQNLNGFQVRSLKVNFKNSY